MNTDAPETPVNDVHTRARVTIDPAQKSGAPCVDGIRLPVYLVAATVWHHGVDVAADTYDITRPQVLVACWFCAAYNLDHLAGGGGEPQRVQGRVWRRRWGGWATAVHGALWNSDHDGIPDPPTEGETA